MGLVSRVGALVVLAALAAGCGRGGGAEAPATLSAGSDSGPSASASADAVMTADQARGDTPSIYANGCYATREATTAPDPEACATGDEQGDTVVLYGDSHAAQWYPAVERIASRTGWWLMPVAKMACPPGGSRVYNVGLKGEYTQCASWHDDAMRLIREQDPVLVIVATRADYYRVMRGDRALTVAESEQPLNAALARDIATFTASGARVVLIRDTPVPGFDVPDCIESRGAEDCTYRLAQALPDDAAQIAAAESAGADVVDLNDNVCGPMSPCSTQIEGLITFRDDDHLAATFAGTLADALEAAMLALSA